jgi:drug/metabolite transporter (DMT)-like permease
MGKVSPFLLVFVNFVHLCISACFPIFNRQMFLEHPFPMYLTFLEMAASIPLSFIVSWMSLGFPRNLTWIVPPLFALPRIILASVFYAGMMLAGNVGFYVSAVDFAVLFRVSTIIVSTIFGMVFLHESLTFYSFIAICLVLYGIFSLASDFRWSTARMASQLQLFVQTAAVVTSSLSALTLKQAIKQLEDTKRGHRTMPMVMWRFVFGSATVLIFSVFFERSVWANLKFVNNFSSTMWVLASMAMGGVYQAVGTILHQHQSLVTLSVVSQMKFLPTLAFSYFLLGETEWSSRQITGFCFLVVGSVFYCMSVAECGTRAEE